MLTIDTTVTADVLDTPEAKKEFINTLISDNIKKIIDSIDANDISAKMGFDDSKKWDEFTSTLKSTLDNTVSTASDEILIGTPEENGQAVPEATPEPTETPTVNESYTANFMTLVESYMVKN